MAYAGHCRELNVSQTILVPLPNNPHHESVFLKPIPISFLVCPNDQKLNQAFHIFVYVHVHKPTHCEVPCLHLSCDNVLFPEDDRVSHQFLKEKLVVDFHIINLHSCVRTSFVQLLSGSYGHLNLPPMHCINALALVFVEGHEHEVDFNPMVD